MLKVENISAHYGKIQALFDVSIQTSTDDIVAIIGANGAGKSTLMKAIMGLQPPSSGTITFDDVPIHKLPTHQIVRHHITYVPEGRRILPKLTVRENLEIGADSRKLKKQELEQEIEQVCAIFPRLKERIKQLGGTLSGGEQQMLAIARGLMNKPSLLLLDEPSLGLAPIIVDEVFDVIKNVHEEMKIPILLVEQNAFNALEISSHAYVLEVGHLVNEGDSQELIKSPEIIKAYLGG